MPIQVIPINGKNPNFDYVRFEDSVKMFFEQKLNNTCKDAKFFLLNNFPIPVSTNLQIDLLLIITIEAKQGNFYAPKKSEEGKNIYLHNQIIPISFVRDYENSNLSVRGNLIGTENENIDYSAEIQEMKYGLEKYLKNKVGLQHYPIFINPLIFIKNQRTKISDITNYLVAKEFDFEALNEYFWRNGQTYFNSYENWRLGYGVVENDVKKIVEQASKDSTYGYLTKKKMEVLGRQHNNLKSLPNELNQYLIEIKGKAGTGKSSMLLSIALKHLENGNNILFLTYNKLLVYDISLLIKAKINKNKDKIIGISSVDTLHRFFYQLCKKFKIGTLMQEPRYNELCTILKNRMDKIYPIISNNKDNEDILTFIQNHPKLDKAEKEQAIEFIKRRKRLSKEEFITQKEKEVSNLLNKNIFLNDYENVLKNLHKAIYKPEEFYNDFNIENKWDIFTESYLNKGANSEEKITLKGFQELIYRSLGGKKRKRTVFIDEAQDCYHLEKEILLKIFGKENIVIANGGKEQLIRYNELCNWGTFERKEIPIKSHTLKSKSFRTKRAIIDFCKFVAQKAGIDFVLEGVETEDEGEIIFDFTKQENNVSDLFATLTTKGEVNENKPYENILTLITPNNEESSNGSVKDEVKINSNNVIVSYNNTEKKGEMGICLCFRRERSSFL